MTGCQHTKKSIEKYKTTPLKTGIYNFNSIANYFLYYAPNIDCVHSSGRIEGDQAEETFDKMINRAGMKKQQRFLKKFRGDPFQKFDLSGDKICFQCNRMVCKQMKGEDELTSLLRHIRNALAHGLIYIWRNNKGKNSYILLEDIDNKEKKITARIVITVDILDDWKAILEEQLATGE